MENTVIARLAHIDEFPVLESRLKESGFSMFDFWKAPCFVAERNGELLGMLPLRFLEKPVKIWQPEPLLVWCETKMRRRRAMYQLWQAAEKWIASPLNRTGVKRYLAITFQDDVKALFEHAGLIPISPTGFEHLSTDEGAQFYFQQL